MRGSFGSIEPCHAMSNQESTRGADAKKLFVRSDFQAVGSATHEQKDIFDQEVTKAFFFCTAQSANIWVLPETSSAISHNFSNPWTRFSCFPLVLPGTSRVLKTHRRRQHQRRCDAVAFIAMATVAVTFVVECSCTEHGRSVGDGDGEEVTPV